jgi:serine/threonine protein kinase/tetratricopeptide (TPR) repeat protein
MTTNEADERIVELVDEYARAVQQRRVANVESFIAQYPQYADRLRRVLPTIDVLADLAAPDATVGANCTDDGPTLTATTLGDFQILRQIGRGGMGVVYEAQQLSLGRRVALKVLPFASALDARQLQRFKNEAQAAAHLHHSNIVPVFAVGCERGVHYYAMQLIEGESLASVIDELAAWHRPEKNSATSTPKSRDRSPGSSTLFPDSPPDRTTRTSSFFRTVADLGIQAAHALHYAHDLGIIHRDIKPANLLVDVRGHLWITDFGLAHMQSETRLTMTGDLMGTLRYMSPEQALGSHDVIDHRTDLYSLGVTLYELLTLSPLVAGVDRQEVLRQIALDDPRPPRRLNSAIPVELETILIKTLAKSPSERYASANDLADDLQRFLRDEPIRARRPTIPQRLVKWTRRHRAIVWTAAVCGILATAVVAALFGWMAHDRHTRRLLVEHEVNLALNEAEGLARQSRWPEATAAARRAAGLLAGVDAAGPANRRYQQVSSDLRLVAQLEDVRFARGEGSNSGWTGGWVDYGRANDEYGRVFREFGFEIERLEPDELERQLDGRTIHTSIAAALDDWALSRLALRPNDRSWQRLLALARAIDKDPRRTDVRQAVERSDKAELLRQARAADDDDLPPQTALLLASALQPDGIRESVVLLARVQRRHADDFWVNYMLAWYLRRGLKSDEATLPYATAAAALRPQSAAAQQVLADALYNVERPEDAILAAREALAIRPDYIPALMTLSEALRGIGRHREALVAARRALALQPRAEFVLLNLGQTLIAAGQHEEAIVRFRQALQANPNHDFLYSELGAALHASGRIDEAIDQYHEAIRRNPRDSKHRERLAESLLRNGRIPEAIAEQQKATELRPHDPQMYVKLARVQFIDRQWARAWAAFTDAVSVYYDADVRNIYAGQDYFDRRLYSDAAACWRLALRRFPSNPDLHARLARALDLMGQPAEAVNSYRTAIRLAPPGDYAHHVGLAGTLLRLDCTDEAFTAAQDALRIKPHGDRGHVVVGEVLCRRGQWSEGIAMIRKVAKARPENREARYALPRMLHDRARTLLDSDISVDPQQLDEALACAREATQLRPSQAEYLTTLAIVHCHRREWSDARAALEKVLAKRGSSPAALERFWLAVTHAGQGDTAAAKSAYDAALRDLNSAPNRADDPRLKSARAAADLALRAQ